MTNKKVLTGIVALAIAAGLCGCGEKKTTEVETGEIKLTYWAPNNASSSVKNYAEMAMYKEIEKATGVKVEFIHPVANQAAEQFNLMIASGEYPDMMENVSSRYQGGLVQAYEDDVIIDMTELLEKYAPNLTSLYKEYPQVMAQTKSHDGKFFVAPLVRGGDALRSYMGLIIRQDWLDDLGLPMPETIEQWHDTLLAFKEQKGADSPFTCESSSFRREPFMGAFGVKNGFYIKDGKVLYGQIQDEYKEYIKTMSQWYKEGLIDTEITLANSKIMEAKLASGAAGAYISGVGGGLGRIPSQVRAVDPAFNAVGAPYPTLNKGDKPQYVQLDPLVSTNTAISISTTNKHPEETMKWIDFMYSKEGHKLCNFGIEGESYDMVDGYPKYSDLLMNNPEGKTLSEIGLTYCRSFISGPFVQDTRYVEQFYSNKEQTAASKLWVEQLQNASDANIYGMLTPEETEKIASKEAELNTYVNEMYVKWLTGEESLDNFEEYKAQVEKMGYKEIAEIRQIAYDRYVAEVGDTSDLDNNVGDFFWK